MGNPESSYRVMKMYIATVSMELGLFHPKEVGLDFFSSRLHRKCKTSLKNNENKELSINQSHREVQIVLFTFKLFSKLSLIDTLKSLLYNWAACIQNWHHWWWHWILSLPLMFTSSPTTYSHISFTAHPSLCLPLSSPGVCTGWAVLVPGSGRAGRLWWPELSHRVDACINSCW